MTTYKGPEQSLGSGREDAPATIVSFRTETLPPEKIDQNSQISQQQVFAKLSDGTEISLATFYPDETWLNTSALQGLTLMEAERVKNSQFSDWLSRES